MNTPTNRGLSRRLTTQRIATALIVLLTLLTGCDTTPAEPTKLLATARTPLATASIPTTLSSRCGRQLTGVAFDGTYYYVAE